MNTQRDFEEFLELLEEHEVDYMIVGGYAVGFHGSPRFTKDLDVFFDAAAENVEKLVRALVAFGFQSRSIPVERLRDLGNVLVIGVPPIRIDLLNRIDGVAFNDAHRRAVRGRYGETEVTFIGREDLIQNKRSTTRTRDQADAEALACDETRDDESTGGA